ncbi:nitroreductase family protein [Geochorda subterranea]|uniref:Nitroreductase family protein n=1 Tax=Geochorda subterranea TaxID=3109564 RepID=A0ABZ1BMI0_9FIRM|nr:nitroreductase family protein [Limnochorda sp. LNt]WRP13761.1 nitroreductase family protein [Limnochorda sp. LNt]
MDTWTCIRTRRTIRDFRPHPVPEATIRRTLEAGRLAPSALNRQPWHFVVVRDRQRLGALAEACSTGRFVAQAAFAVVVAVDPQNRYHQIDGAKAVQQMELAAWSEGVGICWIGGFDAARVAQLVSLPGEWAVLTVLAFGYPADAGRSRRKGVKKALDEAVSWERFGQRA